MPTIPCCCGGGCCGCYTVALILCGEPIDFTLQYTVTGYSPIASHGKWAGSPFSDPGGTDCDCRVMLFSCGTGDDLIPALETEFGEGCVSTGYGGYFGNPPWAFDPLPIPEDYRNWGGLDCTAHGHLIIRIVPTSGDLTGASYRVWRTCGTPTLIASGTFPDVLMGETSPASNPPRNSCCCKCCDPLSFINTDGGGLIGYFSEWDCVSDCIYTEGVSPACCEDYCGVSKRVVIQPTPYGGDMFGGSEGSCQWIDEEGYYHIYGGLPDFNYVFDGICDLGSGIWTRDSNFAFGCRHGPDDLEPGEVVYSPVGYCGTFKVTCTPVAGSWVSCFDPIPGTEMGIRALSSQEPKKKRIPKPNPKAIQKRIRSVAGKKKCGCGK